MEQTDHKRIGPLFREKPFYVSLLFPSLDEERREVALEELVKDDLLHALVFGVKIPGS